MLKRTIRNLAITGTTIVSATILAVLGATGATATTATAASPGQVTIAANTVVPATPADAFQSQEYALFNDGNTHYWLYSHAHNFPVSTTNGEFQGQVWDFGNRANECLLSSTGCQYSTAWEIQLENTGQCLNFAPLDGAGQGYVFLDSCQPNDLNELFWQVQVSGNVYYYRNVEASYELGNEYSYMTALNPSNTGPGVGGCVDEQGPGGGYYARWYKYCETNC